MVEKCGFYRASDGVDHDPCLVRHDPVVGKGCSTNCLESVFSGVFINEGMPSEARHVLVLPTGVCHVRHRGSGDHDCFVVSSAILSVFLLLMKI
jgi:hypothetical protein